MPSLANKVASDAPTFSPALIKATLDVISTVPLLILVGMLSTYSKSCKQVAAAECQVQMRKLTLLCILVVPSSKVNNGVLDVPSNNVSNGVHTRRFRTHTWVATRAQLGINLCSCTDDNDGNTSQTQ